MSCSLLPTVARDLGMLTFHGTSREAASLKERFRGNSREAASLKERFRGPSRPSLRSGSLGMTSALALKKKKKYKTYPRCRNPNTSAIGFSPSVSRNNS